MAEYDSRKSNRIEVTNEYDSTIPRKTIPYNNFVRNGKNVVQKEPTHEDTIRRYLRTATLK